jgi:glycerol-3-phosphate dehydrogenase
MAGGETLRIRPRKGEYIIFDTSMPARVNTVIFGAPTAKGKGVLFAPTVYGNMIAGPTAQEIDDKADKSTSREGLDAVFAGAKRFVPTVEKKYAITVFAGLRAGADTHDFIIEASKSAKNFVNVAGIESPGLTSAPAIAEYVKDILVSIGLPGEKKPGAVRERVPIEVFADASPERKQELIRKDARYANVVCRCEHVTEAEIVQSIHRPCGATTVDGVKFRAGAGMGRCHGGFCLPRVMAILSRELNKPYEEITKSGEGAHILTDRTKGEAACGQM